MMIYSMKIAVIAAGGRSGQAFVEAALAGGHQVNAGVHRHSHLPEHPRLTVMRCDATNKADLKKLLAGQEAVVSFIGHVKGSAPDMQTVATRAIIQVMQELGLKRLISLTGTGVRFPGDAISLVDRLLNTSIALIDPSRVKDGRDHMEVLRQSGLDWTVIRVLKLQNTAPRSFALREHGPTKWFVSRQEVALAVLQVLEQNSFMQQAPIIGRP
jgi:putative NADH-flavin reductase